MSKVNITFHRKEKVNFDKLKAKIEKEKKDEYAKSFAGKSEKVAGDVSSRVNKYLSKALKNRQVVRDNSRVTINTRQPVYSEDKSRFFKTAWKEEKKQLFFDD